MEYPDRSHLWVMAVTDDVGLIFELIVTEYALSDSKFVVEDLLDCTFEPFEFVAACLVPVEEDACEKRVSGASGNSFDKVCRHYHGGARPVMLVEIDLVKIVAYLLMETVSRAKVLAVEATVVEVMVVDE